jgi:uncharacterized protein (DUF1501 family)
MARRLVEVGVPFVEVDLGGWDLHANTHTTLETKLPEMDKAISALVADLAERGLLESTAIIWMGEFGRTPRINQGNGRDHWARCWSIVVGGGGASGIRGGQAYGATDQDGMDVARDRCNIGDVFATVYKALGIETGTQVRDAIGRPFPIAGQNGRPIAGLLPA